MDKKAVVDITSTATPPSSTPAQNEEKASFFRSKILQGIGEWADENPMKATGIAVVAGHQFSARVVGPAYDWAKSGVKGLVARKAGEKVSAEAKNALSLGDALGFVAGACGKLIR